MKAVIYGAGGHGKVSAQVLEAAGFEILGLIDDRPELQGKQVLGYPVLGGREQLLKMEKTGFLVGIGDNLVRKELFSYLLKLGFSPLTAVHPSARIHRTVKLGRGTLVLPGVVVNADTVIGENCILNTLAGVDHDCLIGDTVHIAPGCTLGGGVRVGDDSLLGIGCTIHPHLKLGKGVVVGAGAAVIREVPDYTTVVGVPAKILRKAEAI